MGSISKQPMFKSRAVRIEKIPDRTNKVQIHEKRTAAIEFVEKSKPNAQAVKAQDPTTRHLGYLLGATYEAIDVLMDVFDRLLYRIVLDKEFHSAPKFQRDISQAIYDRMTPFVEKYHDKKEYGQNVSKALRDTLFPIQDEKQARSRHLASCKGFPCILRISLAILQISTRQVRLFGRRTSWMLWSFIPRRYKDKMLGQRRRLR